MRLENGPPLSLARYLRRTEELQALFTVSHLFGHLLLGLLRDHIDMGVERTT